MIGVTGIKKMFGERFRLILICITLLKIIKAFFISDVKTFEDYVIAKNTIEFGSFALLNDGVLNHSFQFPIYPMLLSGVLFVYDNTVTAIILNIILLSFSSVFINQTLKKLNLPLSLSTINLLSIIPLLHPAFIYYELKCVHPFSHDFMMLTASIYLCVSILKEESTLSIEKGILIGLTILGRGTFIVFPLIAIVLLLIKKEIKKSLIILGGVAIMITPWLIHNYVADDITGLTSTTGKILWKGSLHNSEGGNYLNNGKNYYTALSNVELDSLGKMTVSEQNQFFTDKYYSQWSTEPGHVIKMFFIKLKNFWFFSPNSGTEYPTLIKNLLPFYKLLNLLLLIALIGFSIKGSYFKYLLPFILFSFIQSIYYVEARHRLIIDPLLLIILLISISYFSKKKSIP